MRVDFRSFARILALAALPVMASALATDVFVNGVRLEDSTRQALERGYRVPIKRAVLV
jgi:hypothetical protein